MDWERISADLNKKLDPAAIKPPPKGKFGEYVDGYHVISEANRIFGNGGWSYEITRMEQSHAATVTLTGRDGPYEQFRCSYLCTVKVTVGGTFKEGSAVGMGSGKPENMGDVIESAVKEAETDALKRALRTYGNTFGLALYDKSRENIGVEPQPPSAHDRAVIDARVMLESADSLEDLQAVWHGLSEAVKADVMARDAANKRKKQLQSQQKDAA